MNPLPKKPKEILESEIKKELINRLTIDGWYTLVTHGNAYQAGFPDVFICSQKFGIRWVEIKRPNKYSFTQSQLNVFTKFASKNVGVWILTANTDYERRKLFYHSNWSSYIKGGISISDKIPRRIKTGPEGIIQDNIIDKLEADDWFCIETYGNMYQSGLPDIFCCHKKYGTKWIECKNPAGYKFTHNQFRVFPRFAAEGVGIWVLTSSADTNKIFDRPNWHHYMWS